ncbi:MAG TPA: hypothetical protein PLK89_02690 [Acidobacteriota bacterium]|nr:hypothetical protein [Acidobacteriota bacterium]
MIASLLVLAIVVAAVLYVLWPLLGGAPAATAAADDIPPAADREELDAALADLEYDRRAGKLPDEPYAELKAQLESRRREIR